MLIITIKNIINIKMKIDTKFIFILILMIFLKISNSSSSKNVIKNSDDSIDILNKVDELMGESSSKSNTIQSDLKTVNDKSKNKSNENNISKLEIDLLIENDKDKIEKDKTLNFNNELKEEKIKNQNNDRNQIHVDGTVESKIKDINNKNVISKSSISVEDIISKNVFIGDNSPLEDFWKFNVDEDKFIIPNEVLNEDDWNKYLRILSILNSMQFTDNTEEVKDANFQKNNQKNIINSKELINNPPILTTEKEINISENKDNILNPPSFA